LSIWNASGYYVLRYIMVPGITSVVCLILIVSLGTFYDRYGTLRSRFIAM
jgi:hypothetical protein